MAALAPMEGTSTPQLLIPEGVSEAKCSPWWSLSGLHCFHRVV